MSEQDFIEHHANLSFGISSDIQFRQLVVNCWRVDGVGVGHQPHPSAQGNGGLGGSSSPRRRFLVTYRDGSQSVEELDFLLEVRDWSIRWSASVFVGGLSRAVLVDVVNIQQCHINSSCAGLLRLVDGSLALE